MKDQDKAINEVLNGIIDEIEKWKNRKKKFQDNCCAFENESGFQEGLRLSGAIVRASLIQEPIDQDECSHCECDECCDCGKAVDE